ncbi:MAG: hypothetical protein AAF682_08485 [Planctomycetota bacterium]
MIPLASLALRRTLPPGLLVVFALLALAAALRDWGASAEVLAALGGDASTRAASRQGVWLLAAALLVPALAARAAATIPRWRRADAAWLAPRRTGRVACLAATFAGSSVGAVLALLLFFAAAELAAGESDAARRFVRGVEHPPLHVLDGPGAYCELDHLGADELAAGASLLVRPTVAPGRGPTADVLLQVRRGDAVLGEVAALLTGRASVEIPLAPPAADAGGALQLVVRRNAPGAPVLLPDHSVWLLAAASAERDGSAALFAELLLLLLALGAVALGLGAWMRGAVATLLALALWTPTLAWGAAGTWAPGGRLARDLTLLGDGIVPPAPQPAALAGAALALGAGLALAALGLRSWGRTP